MNLEVDVVLGNGYCVVALYAVCLLRIAMWDSLQLIFWVALALSLGIRYCVFCIIWCSLFIYLFFWELPCGSLCNSSFERHFALLIHWVRCGFEFRVDLLWFSARIVTFLFVFFPFPSFFSLWWEFASTSRLQFKLRSCDSLFYSEIYVFVYLYIRMKGFDMWFLLSSSGFVQFIARIYANQTVELWNYTLFSFLIHKHIHKYKLMYIYLYIHICMYVCIYVRIHFVYMCIV